MSKLDNVFLKFGSGYEVIEDYGLIDTADSAFGLGERQELRLLKCKNRQGKQTYLLEETKKGRFMLGYSKQYFVISEKGLNNLNFLLNSKILKTDK